MLNRFFSNVVQFFEQEAGRSTLEYALVFIVLTAICIASVIAMKNDTGKT
jgi:hypothetical protein